jgi:hypothetical protein
MPEAAGPFHHINSIRRWTGFRFPATNALPVPAGPE